MTWFTRRLLIWDLHCVVHAQMFSKPSVRSITVSRCVYVEFYHVLDMHFYFSSKNLVFVMLCSQNNFKTEAWHKCKKCSYARLCYTIENSLLVNCSSFWEEI